MSVVAQGARHGRPAGAAHRDGAATAAAATAPPPAPPPATAARAAPPAAPPRLRAPRRLPAPDGHAHLLAGQAPRAHAAAAARRAEGQVGPTLRFKLPVQIDQFVFGRIENDLFGNVGHYTTKE